MFLYLYPTLNRKVMESIIERIEKHVGFDVDKHEYQEISKLHFVTVKIPKGRSFYHPNMDGMDVYQISNLGEILVSMTIEDKIINK